MKKLLNYNADKLDKITESEWNLLHSLRLQVSMKRYTAKIENFCQGNDGKLKRLDEILSLVEQSITPPGLVIGAPSKNPNTVIMTISLIGLDFKLAFEAIDRLNHNLGKHNWTHRMEILKKKCLGTSDTVAEMKKISSKRVTAYYSLNKNHKTYRPVESFEREMVIASLAGSAKAQEFAKTIDSV